MAVTPPSTPPRSDYHGNLSFDSATSPVLQAVAWLTRVQWLASTQSEDSSAALADCAGYEPPEELSFELKEVVEAVKEFAETHIHNPHLPQLAEAACLSLKPKLVSPIKLYSPPKLTPPRRDMDPSSTARRKLFQEHE